MKPVNTHRNASKAPSGLRIGKAFTLLVHCIYTVRALPLPRARDKQWSGSQALEPRGTGAGPPFPFPAPAAGEGGC